MPSSSFDEEDEGELQVYPTTGVCERARARWILPLSRSLCLIPPRPSPRGVRTRGGLSVGLMAGFGGGGEGFQFGLI